MTNGSNHLQRNNHLKLNYPSFPAVRVTFGVCAIHIIVLKLRGNSRGIFGHSALEERQIFAVFIVEPFDFKVQVHVIGALAQAVLFMLCEVKIKALHESVEGM